MPFPWAAAIGAAGTALGSIFGGGRKNRQAAHDMNERNIRFQQETNQQNRNWALEDWERTNQYNTPAMQMARFKAAGLNPHLIYGNGTEVSQPRNSDATAPHVEKLPVGNLGGDIAQGLFQGAQAYVANRLQQSQIDNLAKTSQVMDADIQNKNAQTVNTIANTARTDQQRQQSDTLFQNTVATAEANLNNTLLTGSKIEQEIRSSKVSNQLTEAQIKAVAKSIETANENIKLMRAEGNNKALDAQLKQLDINLKRQGINPNDPTWVRILGQFIMNGGSNYIDQQNKRFKEKAGKLFKLEN